MKKRIDGDKNPLANDMATIVKWSEQDKKEILKDELLTIKRIAKNDKEEILNELNKK